MFDNVRKLVAGTLHQASIVLSPAPVSVPPSQPGVRADLVEIRVDGIAQAKEHAVWLTKGIDHGQPVAVVRLIDCTSDHLKNIVLNKPNLSPDYRRVIDSILEDRGEALPIQPAQTNVVNDWGD